MKQIQCRHCQKRMRVMKAHSGVTRMLTVMVYVLISVHIISCLWVMTSKVDNFSEDTWLYRKEVINASGADQYLYAIYWAFQTLTTVGFGDIPAITVFERFLALFWMIFGVGFYSFTIGNLSSIISSLDAKSADIRHKIDSFYEFSQRVKLSYKLVDRVVKHLEHSGNKINVTVHQEQLISQLPSALRAEIVKETHAEIIQKVKLLHEKNPDFIWMFLHMLDTQHLMEKSDLYMHQEYAQEVYFIFSGKIQLRTPDGIPFVRFLMGSMFGEVEILFNSLRYCSASAEVKTDLLLVQKKNFLILMESFPKVRQELRRIAKVKVRRHEEAIVKIKSKGGVVKTTLNQIQHSIEESERQLRGGQDLSRRNTRNNFLRMNSKLTIESNKPKSEQVVAGTTIKVYDQPVRKEIITPRTEQKEKQMEEMIQENSNIKNLLRIIEDSEISDDSSQQSHDIYQPTSSDRIRDKSILKSALSHRSIEGGKSTADRKHSSREDIIRKMAEERLTDGRNLLVAPMDTRRSKQMKDSGGQNSALTSILKEESKLILKEKDGQNLEPDLTAEARIAQITTVHAEDWMPIYTPQAQEENDEEKQKSEIARLEELKSGMTQEEVGMLSGKPSRPSQPHSDRLEETQDRKESDRMEEIERQREEAEQYSGMDQQRALTLVSFNENMNLLALNAAHIFRIFDALGTESEYVSGEMLAMKGMMEELQQKQEKSLIYQSEAASGQILKM